MSITRKSEEIGLGQANRICNLPAAQRLEFIAEGLPIVFASAQSLMKASRAIAGFPREGEILERHALEECAKALILVDVARCPAKVVSSRIGWMMRWFGQHLPRLIYVKAQSWKPVSAAQLQDYVDDQRKSHYLEGEYGEYIFPNWELFARESALYADVVGNEDAEPSWHSPLYKTGWELFSDWDCPAYSLVCALEKVGVFTKQSLKIVQDVWGTLDFAGDQSWTETRVLCSQMLEKLRSANCFSGQTTEKDIRCLLGDWQMPMYRIDFSPIKVSLDELRRERERNMPFDY
jgi:hypothetical protein